MNTNLLINHIQLGKSFLVLLSISTNRFTHNEGENSPDENINGGISTLDQQNHFRIANQMQFDLTV